MSGVVFGRLRAMRPLRRPMRPRGLLRQFTGGLSGVRVSSGAQHGPKPRIGQVWGSNAHCGSAAPCGLWVQPLGGRERAQNRVTQSSAWSDR